MTMKHVIWIDPLDEICVKRACSFEETSAKIYLNSVHIPPTLKCHPP